MILGYLNKSLLIAMRARTQASLGFSTSNAHLFFLLQNESDLFGDEKLSSL